MLDSVENRSLEKQQLIAAPQDQNKIGILAKDLQKFVEITKEGQIKEKEVVQL